MTEWSRRRLLRRTGAVVLAATAGCLDVGGVDDTVTTLPTTDDGSGSGSRTPTETDGPTTEPRTDSPTDTATPTRTDEPGTDTPDSSGVVAWRASFDESLTARPVVDDGWVYAASDGGAVRRHSVAAGEIGWAFDAGEPIQDLRVVDGAAFVVSGTDELDAGHTLHALDAATGAERWRFQPTSWWLELLAVADGTVYVSTADDHLEPTGETLYALSQRDGTTTWTADVGDPMEGRLTRDSVFVSTYSRLYAFDRASGETRWVREVSDVSFTTLAVGGGTVVYAYDDYDNEAFGVLVGLDASSGADRWQFHDVPVSATTVYDGALYVGGGGVAAIDPTDGTALWTSETPGFLTRASVTDDRVYAGGEPTRAYERESGDVVWEWQADPPQGGIVPAGVTGGAALFDAFHDASPRNQYKFAVGTDDGTQRWAFEAGTELTDLAVGDEFAVTGGENGRLWALDPTTEA